MKLRICISGFLLSIGTAQAGLIDPNCDPKKLIKGTTSLIGNRCDLQKTVSDTKKEMVGLDHRIDYKKRLEKKGILADKKDKKDSND